MKHTKGPWKKIVYMNEPCEIRGADTRLICEIKDFQIDREDQSNLDLIAAAPEMLEAIETFLKDHDGDIVLPHTDLIKSLRVSLKKARGES